MKTITALLLLVSAALTGCAGTSGSSSSGNAGSGYRNGSGVEMFGTIDTSVRRVETK